MAGFLGRGHNMQDRTTDYKVRSGKPPADWFAIVPQTSIARHLRDLHQQPTPPPPDGLCNSHMAIWNCLARHAMGAAAHISLGEIARQLNLSDREARGRLGNLRYKHRGAIQRLTAQTSIFRLRHIAHPPDRYDDPLLHHRQQRCFICGETKPATDFYRSYTRCSGMENRCKTCSQKIVTYRRLGKWAGVPSAAMHRRAVADIREEYGHEL